MRPAMAYEFKLPDLGEGLTEGEIARWLVSEGQEIAEDDPLVEIQTDKTTVEIPSPAAGTVVRILAQEGEVVPVGSVLVVIGGDGEHPDAEQARAEPAPEQESDSKSTLQQTVAKSDRLAFRRRRSFAGSHRSSVSTSPPSRAPGQADASPRTTSAPSRPAQRPKAGGSRCAGCVA